MRIRSLQLSLCVILLSASFLPAMSLRLRTDTGARVLRSTTNTNTNTKQFASMVNGPAHNSATFGTVIDAASHFAAPFVGQNVSANISDVYTYNVDTADQIATNFELDDAQWANGGPIVGWDVTKNVHTASVDCSGFVTRVLGNVYPDASGKSALTQIITNSDGTIKNFKSAQHPQPFPSAADYASMIIGNHVFTAVSYSQVVNGAVQSQGDFNNVKPGDVLAYGLSSSSQDTGHVMIIEQVQKLQQGQKNTDYWATDLTEFNDSTLQFFSVLVFDSSTFLHYKGQRGLTGNATGVGHGRVLIIANAAGAPIGFLLDSTFKVLSLANVSYTGKNNLGTLGTLAAGRIN